MTSVIVEEYTPVKEVQVHPRTRKLTYVLFAANIALQYFTNIPKNTLQGQ